MGADAYLDRIRYGGPIAASAETLRGLHRAHMLAVPFENLDIHLGIPIVLSVPAFYEKIVTRRRGGFCYELNGLFAWLLAELGFQVALLSARVVSSGRLSPEFDHLLVLVEREGRWIADVGFGDSFLEPLRVELGFAEEKNEYSVVEKQGTSSKPRRSRISRKTRSALLQRKRAASRYREDGSSSPRASVDRLMAAPRPRPSSPSSSP